ncbi:Flp family type IVb pilin [Photobacterium sp. CCB-ST2H9]|uniref:Flp family type IVb pilin n=1 Tax=unclassified Photobacterium TaxID=2628852 RepID=UPI0020034935|nr:Flp family type IVb pilin [Photobacterium sp. CCB-ST2H9]UTM59489.1 Flp family type IVb pilin [Photobacterium sp. CCB-ST2H9]
MKYMTLGWIHVSNFIHRLIHEEKGASAIEYVLIAAVVAGAIIALDLPGVISQAGTKLSTTVSSASQ